MNKELVEEQIVEEQHEQYGDDSRTYLEVEDAFNRFHALAKKLARQQVQRSADKSSNNQDEHNQLASIGLLQAIKRYGIEVTPLQVKSFIKDEFRKHIEDEIKASPWKRTTCPKCGSQAIRECVHKKQARKDEEKPGYLFGMTEHSEANIDWVAGNEDSGEISLAELIEDTSDSFATERELKLEEWRITLDKVLTKLPRTYREVITLRRDGKTWEEISKQTGHARSTVIAHYSKAVRSLQRAVIKPRYAAVGQRIPRLCSLYPWYRPGARIPWSQDPKFSLSIIPGYRAFGDEEQRIMLAERKEYHVEY